ncbi:MAG TPA: AAA family ATPase [Methylococcus sp.]|nr:AAA family ATPase [Methylococcus sp.]
MPTNRDSGLALLEAHPVVREEKDIILSDATRSALETILLEQKRADRLRSDEARPARKFLFCGPPGCGKTLAAEVIAHSLSLPLVLLWPGSVISPLQGSTAANLREVFAFFARHPVVAVFDEFDAYTQGRGDSNDPGELQRSTHALLEMMNNYRGESLLIAITNEESLLDPTVRRSFDEVVHFDLPNLQQIERLLALQLSDLRRNFDIDDENIVILFQGLSHAEIKRVLRRAVAEMSFTGSEFLEKTHLEAALARFHRPKE